MGCVMTSPIPATTLMLATRHARTPATTAVPVCRLRARPLRRTFRREQENDVRPGLAQRSNGRDRRLGRRPVAAYTGRSLRLEVAVQLRRRTGGEHVQLRQLFGVCQA